MAPRSAISSPSPTSCTFLVSPSPMFNLGHDVVPMISVNEYFDLILLTLLIIGLTLNCRS